jgi:glucose/arabinose dehydrogenase
MIFSAACTSPPVPPGPPELDLDNVPVAQGFSNAVAFVCLPDGRFFVTEQATGRIRVIQGGQIVGGSMIDFNVNSWVERGLLGIALHPDFQNNQMVYAYYTASTTAGDSALSAQSNEQRVVRFQIDGNSALLDTVETILTLPVGGNGNHNGGNIHFGSDDKLYVTIGDVASSANAQNLNSLPGSILRINDDGSVPDDNPINTTSPIYAYGLRNSFDFTFHPDTGVIYATENGPENHDEINRIVSGGNYGWPNVQGFADNADEIAFADADESYVDPLIDIAPITFAPTGIAFNTGDVYGADRRGNLFYAYFNNGEILRTVLSGDDLDMASEPVSFTSGFGILSIRDIKFNPADNKLYVLTGTTLFRVDPI